MKICSLEYLVFCVASEAFLTLTALAGDSESFPLQSHCPLSCFTFSFVNFILNYTVSSLSLSLSAIGMNLRLTSLLMLRLNKTEFSSLRQLPSSWLVHSFLMEL